LGPWKDQGLPMYSGSVTYSKQIEGRSGRQYCVKFENWQGTVARVLVNGEIVGRLFAPSPQLDITTHIRSGTNEVTIEVVGSLQNLLGPHHFNIQKGLVTPWNWFFAPPEQPAGKDYHLLEYGLLEDFELLEGKLSK